MKPEEEDMQNDDESIEKSWEEFLKKIPEQIL